MTPVEPRDTRLPAREAVDTRPAGDAVSRPPGRVLAPSGWDRAGLEDLARAAQVPDAEIPALLARLAPELRAVLAELDTGTEDPAGAADRLLSLLRPDLEDGRPQPEARETREVGEWHSDTPTAGEAVPRPPGRGRRASSREGEHGDG